jgi:hypothetical protein
LIIDKLGKGVFSYMIEVLFKYKDALSGDLKAAEHG